MVKNTAETPKKKEYTAPELTVHGKVEEITQSFLNGYGVVSTPV